MRRDAMARDTDEWIESQAERELTARNRVAWREAVRQDGEYRTFLDAPLPDRWYVEAQRVAARLGQPAATAMLLAEGQRRAQAREEARHAADRARAGVRWHHRVEAALWAAVGASAVAVVAHVTLGALLAPHAMWGLWHLAGVVVAVVTLQAACDVRR